MNLVDKIVVSFFQSVTTRTAGFSTVDMYSLNRITKILMCSLMFIGGSPASTAGGIKTVTFALVLLLMRTIIVVLKKQQYSSVVSRKEHS